eukprot:203405_1
MVILLITLSFIIYHSNGQIVSCYGKSTCNCPATSPTSSPTCILDCGTETDACKGSTLNCRDDDSCIIQCTTEATCSDYVTINAQKAKDVTVICEGTDACKVGIDITCGNGNCQLQCNTEKSCIEWGRIDVTASSSFHCTGSHCPLNKLPSPFTASPTESHPTSTSTATVTKHPTVTSNPTPNPTPSPSLRPSISPTLPPSNYPTNLPSKAPTSYRPSLEPTSYFVQTLTLSVTTRHVMTTWVRSNITSDSDASYYISGVLLAGCCYYLSIALYFCIFNTEKRTQNPVNRGRQESNGANKIKHQPQQKVSVTQPRCGHCGELSVIMDIDSDINPVRCGEVSVIMDIDNDINPVRCIVDKNPIGSSVPNMNKSQLNVAEGAETAADSIHNIPVRRARGDTSGIKGEIDSDVDVDLIEFNE